MGVATTWRSFLAKTARNKKVSIVLTAIVSLALLTLPSMPPAAAQEAALQGPLLEVTPERETVPFGTDQLELFAVLQGDRGSGSEPVNIDWENEDDGDGRTYSSPDATCTIPADARECSIIITRGSGTDFWRAWVDQDGISSSAEVDDEEHRRSNPQTDCLQERDEASDCSEQPFQFDEREQTSDPGDANQSGSACGLFVPPAQEPDCTDLVRISWGTAPGELTYADCDDEGGDTERQTVADGESVTYECFAENQFGSQVGDVAVYGEVENGVNDPDPVDGPSYDDPDYQCGPDTSDPIFQDPVPCPIDVTQNEGELGTAEICWWAGQPSEGAALCADEPTGEAQTGETDVGNDRADQTEVTWEDPSGFRLDCEPETDTNPAQTAHEVTCRATSTTNTGASGAVIDVEITGAGDPDSSNTPITPDRTCTTQADGTCSFRHSSTSTGDTTYRAWIDTDDDNTTTEADSNEQQAEGTTPGAAEPDRTDVVTKTWVEEVTTLTITPQTDAAEVGTCNPFTIIAGDSDGNPVQFATVDVEQRHFSAQDQSAGNEPTVSFCMPATGTNPSAVDTSEGDLQPSENAEDESADEEDPDNPGTAGGETEKSTDSQGRVTIGISVQPGGSSDGTGTVALTAFVDEGETDNDDPNAGEPQGEATKTWTPAPESGGRTIDCEPETATTETDEEHVVTCTVEDAQGNPAAGKGVEFSETGPGEIASGASETTDANGEASVTVVNNDGATGAQTITGTLADAVKDEPDSTDECERAAGDPAGAQAGQCSDSVTNNWVEAVAECSDGEDNDGDGQTDFPEDSGCTSAEDNSEASEKCPGKESISGNHIVGTDGDDTIEGTEGDDVICGLGGNDLILGAGGNDLVFGGSGNDSIRGGDGNDDLRGNSGKDELRGNGGNDVLRGGNQNDDLRGNAGDDVLRGQSGFDVIRGGGGHDEGHGGDGNDTLQGFTGRDTLIGNAGNDTIKGGGGADDLRGGKNDDVIAGGKGNDRIRGGPGSDACAGGAGSNDIQGCER